MSESLDQAKSDNQKELQRLTDALAKAHQLALDANQKERAARSESSRAENTRISAEKALVDFLVKTYPDVANEIVKRVKGR